MNFPLQCLVYGDTGAGKSTFAATFPGPMYVAMFDPKSKATPYMRHAATLEKRIEDDFKTQVWDCYSSNGDMYAQVEFFIDADVRAGKGQLYAAEKFDKRINQIFEEVERGDWETVVIDSLSMLEYAVRKTSQYKLNPTTKGGAEQHGMVHYGESAEIIEELVNSKLAHLDCNVILLAHVRMTQDRVRGSLVWNPEAPGTKSRRIPAAFGEVYYIHVNNDGEHLLQTALGNEYMASSQIPAPNPCEPTYNALWANSKVLA